MGKDKKNKGDKGPAESAVLSTFKTLGQNKLVSEVVAAALVATAAALKDSDKARRFASEAGDQLEKLSKDGAARGSAMWQLALDIGRRALEGAGQDASKAKRATPKSKSKAPVAVRASAAQPKAKSGKPKAKSGKPKAKSAKPKADRASKSA